MTRIFIVEDDPITRRSLCDRIAADGEFEVAAAVGSCEEIRFILQTREPDVLLVDLGLPDGSGIDVIADAASRYPRLKIMVVTVFGDEKRVVSAIKAGAVGYLLKSDHSQKIGVAIRQLLEGGSPISPAIARHLIRLFKSEDDASDKAAHREPLTPREQEILSLAAKGFSYVEIARYLQLSVNTIANHTRLIYEKLSVKSRAQAVYEASRLGLLDHC